MYQIIKKIAGYILLINQIITNVLISHPNIQKVVLNTPITFVVRFLNIFYLLLAILQCYEFSQLANKNIDSVISLTTSVSGSILYNAATLGSMITFALQASFAAGPALVGVAFFIYLLNDLILAGIQLKRAYDSRHLPAQKEAFLKQASQYFLNAFTTFLNILALVFIFIIPMNPLGTFLTVFFLAVLIGQVVWTLLPKESPEPTNCQPIEVPVLQSSFSSCNHNFILQSLTNEVQKKEYLSQCIENKFLKVHNKVLNPKRASKIQLLDNLNILLNEKQTMLNKTTLMAPYPGLFQSFFKDKNDLEQLVDAVITLKTAAPESHPPVRFVS